MSALGMLPELSLPSLDEVGSALGSAATTAGTAGLSSIFQSAPGTNAPAPASNPSSIFGFSTSSIIVVVIGMILIVVGLFSFKEVQSAAVTATKAAAV